MIAKGSSHWNWKGGRRKDNLGYVLIYSPNHPFKNFQGYVFEHRLVMEKKLDRYLTKKEIIHHINGIRNDNKIENLMLVDNKEHTIIHKTGKILSLETRLKISKKHKGKSFSPKTQLKKGWQNTEWGKKVILKMKGKRKINSRKFLNNL